MADPAQDVVSCNGCRACCKNEHVLLHPEHDPNPYQYLTIPTRRGDGEPALMLRHKPNGECIYLAASGCTIHNRAPWACRQFDCVKWFKGFPEAMQELLTPDDIDGEVVKAAKRLLGHAG